MRLCDPDCVFDLQRWHHFVTTSPKQARAMVRRVCSGDEARSTTLAEHSPAVVALRSSFTCFCGRSFRSQAALCGHQGTDHGKEAPEFRYCPEDGVCPSCLVSFSNRKLLAAHLRYRSGYVCFLNCVLHQAPLSGEELVRIRTLERLYEAKREKVGLPRYMAEKSRLRLHNPLFPFRDTDGSFISEASNLHPFGPNRRKYAPVDDSDSELEGCCNTSGFAPCLESCCLCRGSGL